MNDCSIQGLLMSVNELQARNISAAMPNDSPVLCFTLPCMFSLCDTFNAGFNFLLFDLWLHIPS